MQRIFKYGDSSNISLTPDKELNILIYWTTSYVIIHRTYELLKMVHFFLAHPVHLLTYFNYMYIFTYLTTRTMYAIHNYTWGSNNVWIRTEYWPVPGSAPTEQTSLGWDVKHTMWRCGYFSVKYAFHAVTNSTGARSTLFSTRIMCFFVLFTT